MDRFYTTTLDFTHGLSDIFRTGINTEPISKPETAITKELEKSSPSKKTGLDLRGRKSLAKRILKAIQPQLETAVRAEADITGKAVDKQLKELEIAIEAGLQTGPDSISLGSSFGDIEMDQDHDVEMTDVPRLKANGYHDRNSAVEYDSTDVNMEEADAAGEDEVGTVITVQETPNTSPLLEVNGNVSQIKPNNATGSKSADTPPDTNGYSSAPEAFQPSPPTPALSNRDVSGDHPDFLAQGGIPWYLKDFQPEGTSLLQGNEGGASFNDVNLEEDGAVGDQGEAPVVTASPSKSKKAKPKKKGRRR